MPRRRRSAHGGYVYHVLNRAVGRARLFKSEGDYAAFERVLGEAHEQTPMRLLAFCLMPNHWHLVVWPRHDGELSEWMRWLTVTHTQRWHAAHGTSGTGPLYQGRFKSFPVAEDEHYYSVCCYVERNPLRANLVDRVEMWRWSSAWHRLQRSPAVPLAVGPLPWPRDWLKHVQQPQTEAELAALRRAVVRGAPFGEADWQVRTARKLDLESTLRPRGRPRKTTEPMRPEA
ncbi:MAG: transposase [Planctomycetaceae bacterium]